MNLSPKSKQDTSFTGYGWKKIVDDTYIDNIEIPITTQEGETNSSEISKYKKIVNLLTAVPSPFARAYMFYGLMNMNGLDKESNLYIMKSFLQKELVGLLSAIATDSLLFEIKTIKLSKIDIANQSEEDFPIKDYFQLNKILPNFIKNNDWKNWKIISDTENTREDVLELDLLYFKENNKEKLVAYIYPNTLLVTTQDYEINLTKNYLKDGKFYNSEDVLNDTTSAYINMLINELKSVKKESNNVGEHYFDTILAFLVSINKTANTEFNNDVAIFTRDCKVHNIFNSQKRFEYIEGQFIRSEKAEAFLLSDLFLDTSVCELLDFSSSSIENTSNFLLLNNITEKDKENEKQGINIIPKFSWPLSEKGIAYLQDAMEDRDANVMKQGEHLYDKKNKTVSLDFKINIGNQKYYKFQKRYKIAENKIRNKQIIIWPDFIANDNDNKWDEGYYFYSELSQYKVRDIIAKPITKEGDCFTILESEAKSKNGYEIVHSEKPFYGVTFKNISTDKENGILFRKILPNKTILTSNIENTFNVGLDFGSNNTCIRVKQSNYNNNNVDVSTFDTETVSIKNRRLFFIGKEIHSNKEVPANKHEMIFFTNEEITSNQIKSILLKQNNSDFVLSQKRSDKPIEQITKNLIYSTPVFEKNISLKETDHRNSKMTILFGEEEYELVYNLKWNMDSNSNNLIISYLSYLISLIKAELYTNNQGYIFKLAWAFPGVDPVMTDYYNSEIWSRLNNKFQISQISESQAIHYYMGSKEGKVDSYKTTLGIGIDVGGSTTDIVIRLDNDNYHQESLKIAAGTLAKQTTSEANFLKMTKEYILDNNIEELKEFVNNIEDNDKQANMYLFNQLVNHIDYKEQEHVGAEEFILRENLYKKIKVNSKNLFIINAYITGVLLMHTGAQAAIKVKQLKDNGTNVNTLDIKIYGKGGRVFDWIATQFPNNPFFKKSIIYGLSLILNKEERSGIDIKIETPSSENRSVDVLKTEVATGLCQFLSSLTKDETRSNTNNNTTIDDVDDIDDSEEKINENQSDDTQKMSEAIYVFEELVHHSDSNKKYEPSSIINRDLLEKISEYNGVEPKYFNRFIFKLFLPFVNDNNNGLANNLNFENYHKDWNLPTFISNHEICKRVILDKNTEIKTSIFALEAECFLENILLPTLNK